MHLLPLGGNRCLGARALYYLFGLCKWSTVLPEVTARLHFPWLPSRAMRSLWPDAGCWGWRWCEPLCTEKGTEAPRSGDHKASVERHLGLQLWVPGLFIPLLSKLSGLLCCRGNSRTKAGGSSYLLALSVHHRLFHWLLCNPANPVSFFLIEVQLIYNVVLVSAVLRSDSVIHTHIYIIFHILFHYSLLKDI